MFLTYEEGIRGGICNKVHSYAEANNKYMKNYDKCMLMLITCMVGQSVKSCL